MAFTSLNDALSTKMKGQKPLQKQVQAAQAVLIAEEIFRELFTPEMAIHVKPLFLKNRTLTVTCSSAAMAQEIRLRQGEIVEKMNTKLAGHEVDRIRYLA